MHALLIFLTTWDVVGAAVAIMNLHGVAKRIAKVANSRGRRCGPHNTSGQGCRGTTDRGNQYSRLHVGFFFSRRRRHSAAAGCASRIVGLFNEKVADAVMAPTGQTTLQLRASKRSDQGFPDFRAGRLVVTRVESDTEQMAPKTWRSCRVQRHHQACRRSG